jgi:protein gp37
MNIRPRVFCASLADWLDDEVPIEWLVDLLSLIHATEGLDWLLLTKRPENWKERIEAAADTLRGNDSKWPLMCLLNWWIEGNAPRNVWIGTTVEDQERADIRIPDLLEIPAKVRFLSCEPLLGPLNLEPAFSFIREVHHKDTPIHWVICGGESGLNARPMLPNWARSLRDQCAAAGVSFLFKQWGEWLPACQSDIPTATNPNHISLRVGKKEAGRTLDGREHNDFPL